jgi:hypothetical protein
MGLEPKFTQADVKARMNKFVQVIEKRQIQRLQYLGEMCVKKAREIPAEVGFTDQTGNLRSSIGYMVFKDGVAVHQGYTVTNGGNEGRIQGETLAKKVGAKYKQGISLVVTAGMDYALYVEANGRDVLTSAEMLARQELPKMLNELKQNINKSLSEV